MNHFYRGAFLVFLSAVGFGLIPIFALYAYKGGANVNTLLFLRFTAAAIFFFILIMVRGIKFQLTRSHVLSLFILGSVLYTLQSNFYFSSVKFIPASLAVLLFYTYPVFVALLSSLVIREKLSGQTLASIALSIIGLIMVLGNSFNNINPLGIMLAFGSALVYSLYIVLGNRVVHQLPALLTSAFVTLFASISYLLMGISTSCIKLDLSAGAWVAVAGIVLFSTIMAILTFFRGIELIGSTKASILSMIEPLVTIGFSALLFYERLSWVQLLGGIFVVLSSVYVVSAEVRKGVDKLTNEI